MALNDLIPGMTDADLISLRANAMRLIEHGAPAQQLAATDILPVIDAETAARKAALPAPEPKPKRAPRSRKAVAA